MKAKYRLKEWTKEEIRDFWGAPEEEEEEEEEEDNSACTFISQNEEKQLTNR